MASSPKQMRDSMIENMAKNTGKSLEEWLEVCKASDAQKHGQLLKWLKGEHGMTHGFANLVAFVKINGPIVDDNDDELVTAQYAGAKADLLPIYEALIKAIGAFGGDYEISPKKTYVSLRRGKQFAIVQPSTKTRLDLGLNLKGVDVTDRLETSGSFNSMCSHRVRLTGINDVDAELLGWIKQAYELA